MFTVNMNWGITAGLILIIAGTALTLWAASRPNRIQVSGDNLVIKGNYGYIVSADFILISNIPRSCMSLPFRGNIFSSTRKTLKRQPDCLRRYWIP